MNQADIKCCFYRHTSGLDIVCEGGSKAFVNKKAQKFYLKMFCQDLKGCQECVLYKMADVKYE